MATVKELQAQARSAGVSTRGSKAQLERRLAGHPAARPASPAQQAKAAAPPAPKRREVPLAQRVAAAQRQGYVGDDAGDLADAGTPARPPIESGVRGAPGGHPDDPTSRGNVGGGR